MTDAVSDKKDDLHPVQSSVWQSQSAENVQSTGDVRKNFPTTPMSNGVVLSANTMTVTRKVRSRQQTITVESQVSREVNVAFDEIKRMEDLDNPIEELRRRMQKLFNEKEKEYLYKLSEVEKNRNEELAVCKIKFDCASKTIQKLHTFWKLYSTQATNNGDVPPQVQQNGNRLSPSKVVLPNTNTSPDSRSITPDAFNEIVRERNSLRDELRELENSYSDLFKRYEKMRENCVLLKNAEECLKRNAEDEAAKCEKLLMMYNDLRNSAAEELQKANYELERIQKQHEENTLNMRCRLKRNESEINTLMMTIQGKDNQIEELNKLCDDLMRKNGVIDEEAVSIADSLDDFS